MDIYERILEKISSYNFLNYIIPGTILSIILNKVYGWDVLYRDNWYLSCIIFYFVGMLNGRVGSLIVEPIVIRCFNVDRVSYGEYVKAERIDHKIAVLDSQKNVYRSFLSMSIILICVELIDGLQINCDELLELRMLIFLFLLIIIFIVSYAKQSRYVCNRIRVTAKDQQTL